MNTRKITADYRLSQWTHLLQERSACGESIKDFCHRHGVSRHAYFYWQRKLRAAVCEELAVQSSDNLLPAGWAVCAEESVSVQSPTVTIEIGKCRVAVDADTSPEILEKVCRVLTELC